MLSEIESVKTGDNTWTVEAQTSDGGIRRTIFIDDDAEARAEQYAEILRSQGLLCTKRRKLQEKQDASS